MAFCVNCGKELAEGAKFCFECGAAVGGGNNDVRKTEYVGKIVKCPNCGNELNAMDAICPSCGMQITGKQVASSVQKFADELTQIENATTFSLNPLHSIMAKGYGDKKFERKLSLIKNFPIPNTVEEITEFLLLADANIDVRYGKQTMSNKLVGRPGNTNYAGVTLANAWISKMQQVYKKAEIAFASDSAFSKIREIYEKKMAELKIKI